MLIDWFTVAAQLLNFLILVWLMKRFLYQPILKALDAREQRIAAQLADAQAKKSEAEAERAEFLLKNEEFAQQRVAMMLKASEEASAERQRLFDAARNDAEGLRAKQQVSLHNEYQQFSQEIARRTRAEVLAIARKALADLSGVALEARMVELFVERLRGMDDAQKQLLLDLPPDTEVLVHTAFELAPAQRALIEATLAGISPTAMQIHYQVSEYLLGGIELVLGGQKIAWSISDYMDSLEKDLNNLLKAQAEAGKDDDAK